MRDYPRAATMHQTRPDGHQEQEAEAVFRVVLRPIATSLPLGFFAFTVGTVLLSFSCSPR